MSQIPLQTAFLKFTTKYVGHDYGFASSLFREFFRVKEQGSHCSNTELQKLTLTSEEILELETEKRRNVRLLFSPHQFSLMLIETPISIFYRKPNPGSFLSSLLFSVSEGLTRLLESRFESLNEKYLYVEEEEFNQACNRFFHNISKEEELAPGHQEFVAGACQEGRFLACLELFNNYAQGIFNLLNKYQREEDYEEDGSVSLYSQP